MKELSKLLLTFESSVSDSTSSADRFREMCLESARGCTRGSPTCVYQLGSETARMTAKRHSPARARELALWSMSTVLLVVKEQLAASCRVNERVALGYVNEQIATAKVCHAHAEHSVCFASNHNQCSVLDNQCARDNALRPTILTSMALQKTYRSYGTIHALSSRKAITPNTFAHFG